MNWRALRDGGIFFLLVTLLAASLLGGSYLFLREELKQEALSQHNRQVNNQLNLWQEQLYDSKWDSLADTGDDARHLGSYDEAKLMAETLVWYVYPDGHSIIEGTAVIGLDGKVRPGKQAAVIDDTGRPLPPAELARLERDKPWLRHPWLDSYAFVIRAFEQDPQRENLISPLIQAPGRLVFVVAAPWRDRDGLLQGAVIQQLAIKQVFGDLIGLGAQGVSLWIMDSKGTLGMATDSLAQASAKAFVASGMLPQAIAQGRKDAQEGKFGAKGAMAQTLDHGTPQLSWRTMEDSFVVAVVENTVTVGGQGGHTLKLFGAIALISLMSLAWAGLTYTVLYLGRESRMLEKAALRRYTGTVSHRVRNSLCVLRGENEMLRHKLARDDDSLGQNLDNAAQAIEDIEATVAELEQLSQGKADLVYDGQAGRRSMYRLRPGKKQGERA